VRLVLDTNVLLAGVFTSGICQTVLDLSLASPRHTVICSNYILEEFLAAASRKFHAPTVEARRAVEAIRGQVEIVEPAPVPPGACRDRNDLPILGTAIAGNAESLVTGDGDLLDLGVFQAISIVSPRAIVGRLA
jgi:uncharacterized protein